MTPWMIAELETPNPVGPLENEIQQGIATLRGMWV
jgi:hypothetical protein